MIACKICSAEITAPRRKSYCSEECAYEGNKRNALAMYWEEDRKPRRNEFCTFCGCSVEDLLGYNRKTCNDEDCKARLRREQNSRYKARYRQEDSATYAIKQAEYKRRYITRLNNAAN